MKTLKWIIDKYIFEEYDEKLAEEIRNSGMEVVFYDELKYESFEDFLNKKIKEDDMVIFYGSLQHGRKMLKKSLYPGIYLTLENYECFKYYGYFGNDLLNSNYLMMGLNDITRRKDEIFDTFKTDFVFIRPSNGFKSFPGQMLPKENFESELDILTKSYGGIDLDQLVVVSPKIEIEEEYRFIVVDGKVVSGSLYLDREGRKNWVSYYDKVCYDQQAINFAQKMSKIYQPDPAYTIDVCKLSSGEYKLIEINSLCCASMYGNHYKFVVDAMNKLCVSDYNDVFE